MYKIMVVDDDKKIVQMIADFMRIERIQVVPAYNGKEALEKINPNIELIILDINMDHLNGIEVCKALRQNCRTPVIFLTANTTQCDKILGLGIGADDYLTKPFDPIELVARVKAHIRRYRDYNSQITPASDNNIIRFDNITVFRNAYRAVRDGKEIYFSMTEFKLLLYFIENSCKALTRKQILHDVWGNGQYDDNTVTTYVKRLRLKLEPNEDEPTYIKSIRGIGYIFEMCSRNRLEI